MVFVDADFFIGLYLSSDPHHARCLAISAQVTDDLLTSGDVIDEVATKLSYFHQRQLAQKFLKDVTTQNIRIIFAGHKLLAAAQKIFNDVSRAHVSLTDCMNMAIAREKKISLFLSFDAIYEKCGFKLFASSPT